MDNFEKVERLVAKANVSYEDAKKALDEANGDMLDAIIILEKQGKVKKPEQSVYTTNYEQQGNFTDVPSAVQKSNNTEAKSVFKSIGDGLKKAFKYTVDNSLKITKKNETIIKLPLWIAIILLLAAWELLIIVMIISLFFDCKYSIEGKNDSKEVNDILNQASDLAGKAKDSFNEKTAENANAETYNAEGTYNAAASQPAAAQEPTVENPDGSKAE